MQLPYEKIDILGHGYFGTVWKVINIDSKEIYAMKQIHLNRIDGWSMLFKEIDILQKVDHENIVKYFDSFILGGVDGNYLVTEF